MNIFEAEYAGDQAEYTRRMMKVEQEIEMRNGIVLE